MNKKQEFVIQQYYSVTPDESAIEKHYRQYPSRDSQELQREQERMHRLFHSILSDEKALQAVLTYQVVTEHGVRCNDTVEEMCHDHYGKEDVRFSDILTQIASCFTPEDQAWWTWFIQELGDDQESIDLTMEGLQNCFEAMPAGWNIGKTHK